MPRKIRQLRADLEREGFILSGRGGHRVYRHPLYPGHVSIAHNDGDDAPGYLDREVKQAVRHVQEEKRKGQHP